MKRLIQLVLGTCIIAGYCSAAVSGVAVIVHPDNNNNVTSLQVRNIFLGKMPTFPNGSEVVAIEQNTGSSTRQVFNKEILRKDEGSLNSYWARMLFSSKAKPPRVANNANEIKSLIASNKNAIGYIDTSEVDASVKVVLTIP